MYKEALLVGTLIFASTVPAPSAFANKWQVDFASRKNEEASKPEYTGTVQYFFSPLNHTTNTPWAEVPFTDRISYIEFGSSYYKDTHSPMILNGDDSDIELPEFDTRAKAFWTSYTHRNESSPHSFKVGLGLQNSKFQSPSTSPSLDLTDSDDGFLYSAEGYWFSANSSDSNSFVYQLGYDYYLADTWTVGVNTALNEFDTADTYLINVNTNRLWDLGNENWLGLRLGVTQEIYVFENGDRDNYRFEAEGRYYFSPKTGVSLGVGIPEEGRTKTYKLGVHHFLTDNIFIDIDYQLTRIDFGYNPVLPDGSVIEDEQSIFGLKLGARF